MLLLARDGKCVRRMSQIGSQAAARLGNTPLSWVDALITLYADVLERAGHPLDAARGGARHFVKNSASQGQRV
jgi:hypothetical protein